MMCLIYGDMTLRYMREGEKSNLEEGERGFWVVNTVFKELYIFQFFPSMKQAWALQINVSVKDFTRREN